MPDDDDVLSIDLDDLRVREVEEIEDLLDCNIDQIDKKVRRGKMMRAIGYIVKRREDPDFTWEQAGELRVQMAEAPPTEASD